jgi:hypothetical protein
MPRKGERNGDTSNPRGRAYGLDIPDFTSVLAGYDLENIMSEIKDPMKESWQTRRLFGIDT